MLSKKIYSLMGAAMLLGVAEAQAQDNVLKVDIFQPIVNTGAFSFEHKLSESSSFQLGVSFTANYNEEDYFFNGYNTSRKTSGFGIMPQYRFYLSEKHPALEGFYVAPFVRYQYLSQTGTYQDVNTGSNRDIDASLNAFGAGALVGRHWIFKQRFSLDAFLGPSYMVSSVTSNEPEIDRDDFLGFYEDMNYGLQGGVTFGIAF